MSNEINDDRDLTPEELKWMARLERCLNAMPPDIEICVKSSGVVDIRNKGAGKRYSDQYGDADSPPVLDSIHPRTVRRIDGRDSML